MSNDLMARTLVTRVEEGQQRDGEAEWGPTSSSDSDSDQAFTILSTPQQGNWFTQTWASLWGTGTPNTPVKATTAPRTATHVRRTRSDFSVQRAPPRYHGRMSWEKTTTVEGSVGDGSPRSEAAPSARRSTPARRRARSDHQPRVGQQALHGASRRGRTRAATGDATALSAMTHTDDASAHPIDAAAGSPRPRRSKRRAGSLGRSFVDTYSEDNLIAQPHPFFDHDEAEAAVAAEYTGDAMNRAAAVGRTGLGQGNRRNNDVTALTASTLSATTPDAAERWHGYQRRGDSHTDIEYTMYQDMDDDDDTEGWPRGAPSRRPMFEWTDRPIAYPTEAPAVMEEAAAMEDEALDDGYERESEEVAERQRHGMRHRAAWGTARQGQAGVVRKRRSPRLLERRKVDAHEVASPATSSVPGRETGGTTGHHGKQGDGIDVPNAPTSASPRSRKGGAPRGRPMQQVHPAAAAQAMRQETRRSRGYISQWIHLSPLATLSDLSLHLLPDAFFPKRRLALPKRRKTLVLDLDETLIHSTSLGAAHYDYLIEVIFERHACLYYVFKRPHVDYFLDKVSRWYDLVVFTASLPEYADPVINRLDAGRNILMKRLYRQSCTSTPLGYAKNLALVREDLADLCLLDNAPASYQINPANGIPIKSWFSDLSDECLLDLLPFLDALRFTQDVRSILSLRR